MLIAIFSSAITLAAYNFLGFNNRDVVMNESSTPTITGRLAALTGNDAAAPGDFSYAAESATPMVVHIRTTMTRTVRQQQRNPVAGRNSARQHPPGKVGDPCVQFSPAQALGAVDCGETVGMARS